MAASLQDVTTTLNNMAQALGRLATATIEIDTNDSGLATVTTPLSWPTTLTGVSAQIIPGNTSRIGMIIHNPGAINIYVCPATDGSGSPLAAGGAGSILLAPQQSIAINGLCNNAWNGVSSGANTPVTVLEFLRSI
jgi:hypothetical protein